jgi:hypothetical protein
MTGKAEFSAEEWEKISEAPATAGLLVMTAQRGGVFRETLPIAKAYTEARQKHGQSPLLDELVSSKPRMDHIATTRPRNSGRRVSVTSATRSRCWSQRPRPPRCPSSGSSSSRSLSG